ncbi:Asp23/Gls24 family envelope stress response protein [Actinoalloteichus spitiensis]|uniref:Asp23/Gls24 family envelope stress response protein n=1 Tax=Actinoalloteichus spitiensis TaxID=252394 RepID=UPI00038106F2|nr:Asp23/Gls24 family envelope stress response protein [Actinoalloteichus spitiensis]
MTPGAHRLERARPRRPTAAEEAGTGGEEGRPSQVDRAAPDDAGERGTLDIRDQVLRKVARQAAGESPHVLPSGGSGPGGAKVRISDPGDGLHLRLDVALRYPCRVRSAVAEIRERVRAGLLRATGREARTVDVRIVALRGVSPARVE